MKSFLRNSPTKYTKIHGRFYLSLILVFFVGKMLSDFNTPVHFRNVGLI